MTYRELLYKAQRLINHNEITLGEYDEMTKPLNREIGTCKDCCHRDPEDKKCDCGHDIQWQLPREDNWYCADFKEVLNE